MIGRCGGEEKDERERRKTIEKEKMLVVKMKKVMEIGGKHRKREGGMW